MENLNILGPIYSQHFWQISDGAAYFLHILGGLGLLLGIVDVSDVSGRGGLVQRDATFLWCARQCDVIACPVMPVRTI